MSLFPAPFQLPTANYSPFRVALLGAPGVGKKSFLSRLKSSNNLVNLPVLLKKSNNATLQISLEISSSPFNLPDDCQATIIMFSLADRQSLREVLFFYNAQARLWQHPVIFLGNKSDLLQRQVTTEEVAELLEETEDLHKYVEISTKYSKDVRKPLEYILEQLIPDRCLMFLRD